MAKENLAESLNEKERIEIGRYCLERYKEDENSRAGWKEKHARYLQLYHQELKSDSRLDWGSTESIPELTNAVNQFQARAYKAIFPSRDFVAGLPLDDLSADAKLSAERVAKHMNYQLTVEDRNYKRDKNAMLKASALHGSDFSKVFWSPVKERTVIQRVRAADFVVPYGMGPRRLDEIERKTQIVRMSSNKAKYLERQKYFVRAPTPENYTGTDEGVQQVEDEVQGMVPDSGHKECIVLEQHCLLDLDKDGIAEPYIVHIDQNKVEAIRITERWDEEDEEKQPEEYFVHYGFLENPDGFYHLGYGHLLGQLNEAINKMLRQIIDAGQLANIGNMSGFIDDSLGVKGDDVELDLGKFIKITRSRDDISKSIFQFQFPGPNAALMETMKYLQDVIQRIGSTTDAVTGDVQKVLQPLTIMTMLEQSLQLPTAIMEQIGMSFEEELDKVHKLNRKHFKERKKFVSGDEMIYVFPADYEQNVKITPILDPRMMTREQRLAKSQAIYQFVMQNPMLAQNPVAVEDATQRVLAAMDAEDPGRLLPDMDKRPPQNIDNQVKENMLFLLKPEQRPKFDVFSSQNHQEHLMQMQQFTQSPAGTTLSQEGMLAFKEHEQKHLAFLYAQQMGMLNGQGRPRTLDEFAGDSMGDEESFGALLAGAGTQNMPPGIGGEIPGPSGGVGLPEEPYNVGISPEEIVPGNISYGAIGIRPEDVMRKGTE